MEVCNLVDIGNIQKSCVDVASIKYGVPDQCVFNFTVKNFSHLINKNSGYFITSEKFGLENNTEYSWSLILSTGNSSGEETDCLHLLVISSTGNPLPMFPVKATATAVAINKNNEILVKQNMILNFSLSINVKHQFISKELFKKSNFFIDDELIIIFFINATFYKNSNNINNQMLITQENKSSKKRKVDDNSDDQNVSKTYIWDKIYQERLYTDVNLIVGSRKKLKAHRCFLAAASPIFKEKIDNDKSQSVTVIDVSDFSEDSINAMLKFIYTISIENLADIAHELIAVANRYGIIELKDICEEYLSSSLNIENAINMLTFAETNSAKTLKDLATKFIIKNIKIFKPREDFLKFIDSHPEILKQIFLSMV